MTAVVDSKLRVRIPGAKPGQVLAYEKTAEGQWTLTLVQKVDIKPRPLDRHLYDDLRQEQIDLERASAKVNVSGEER